MQLIDQVTMEEAAMFVRSQDSSGNVYNLSAVYIKIYCPAGTAVGNGAIYLSSKVTDNVYGVDRCGYVYVNGIVNTASRWTYLFAHKIHNKWDGYYCGGCTAEIPIAETLKQLRSTTEYIATPASERPTIKTISIAVTIPAGSVITIYGVRA